MSRDCCERRPPNKQVNSHASASAQLSLEARKRNSIGKDGFQSRALGSLLDIHIRVVVAQQKQPLQGHPLELPEYRGAYTKLEIDISRARSLFKTDHQIHHFLV